jgi:HAD superfamily phosphatase (TIGR01668 family)
LLESFVPNLYVESIYAIDFQRLRKNGLKSIIVDLDNTLVETKRRYATDRLMHWLQEAKDAGLNVMIVSNNTKLRVSTFSAPLGIPYIHTAKKPLNHAFKKALKTLQSDKSETAVIGDQLLTDVFGGNRMGMFTILVVPISRQDNIFTKLNRRIERQLFRWMDKNHLLKRG